MLLFGPQRKNIVNPAVLDRGAGWTIQFFGKPVLISYTGAFSLALSTILMIALYILVQKTKLGRSMRAVAQDKDSAALMGVDVNRVISQTFIISGILAGASGVMWGIHMGLVNHITGSLPGIKAFTAAVLGGVGNIPGAMLGGMTLGVIESIGPALLGIDFQLKDVIAFLTLIVVLIIDIRHFGERLSEENYENHPFFQGICHRDRVGIVLTFLFYWFYRDRFGIAFQTVRSACTDQCDAQDFLCRLIFCFDWNVGRVQPG